MKIVISANEAWNIYNYRFFFVKKLIELDYEVIIFAKKDNYSQYLEQIGCKSYHIDFASSKINILLNFIIIIKFLAGTRSSSRGSNRTIRRSSY